MRRVMLLAVLLVGCSSSQAQWELGCEADSCGDGAACARETVGTEEVSYCTVPCSGDEQCADVEGVGASRATCIAGACRLVGCSGAAEVSCPEGFACGADLCVPSP